MTHVLLTLTVRHTGDCSLYFRLSPMKIWDNIASLEVLWSGWIIVKFRRKTVKSEAV